MTKQIALYQRFKRNTRKWNRKVRLYKPRDTVRISVYRGNAEGIARACNDATDLKAKIVVLNEPASEGEQLVRQCESAIESGNCWSVFKKAERSTG